jgi:hypothetical protein
MEHQTGVLYQFQFKIAYPTLPWRGGVSKHLEKEKTKIAKKWNSSIAINLKNHPY